MRHDDLAELLDRHGDLVWALALHATGDEALAERVVGQAWANAERLAPRRDRSIAERWWLLRLVHLECETAARGTSPVPLDAPLADDPAAVLAQALLTLPVRRRSAWVMHELMGLRAVDVAAVLTTSEWRAQALVVEARKGLVAHFVRRERRAVQQRLAHPTPA